MVLPLSWTTTALGVHALGILAHLTATQALGSESQSRWEVAFGSSLMSDYNFRGVTSSAHRPSVAAYFEPRYKMESDLELYIGLNATSVALPNRSRIQMYYYTGARRVFGRLSLDVAVAYVDYPGGSLFDGSSEAHCTNGAFSLGSCNVSKASASYWEPFGKASLAISDGLSLTGNVFYSPSWVNTGAFGIFVSSGAKIGFPSFLLPTNVGASVSGEVGHYWFGTTDFVLRGPCVSGRGQAARLHHLECGPELYLSSDDFGFSLLRHKSFKSRLQRPHERPHRKFSRRQCHYSH